MGCEAHADIGGTDAHADIGRRGKGSRYRKNGGSGAKNRYRGSGRDRHRSTDIGEGNAAGRDTRGGAEHARKRRRALPPFLFQGMRRLVGDIGAAVPPARPKGKRKERNEKTARQTITPKARDPRKDRSRPHQKTIHTTDPDHIRETQKTPRRTPHPENSSNPKKTMGVLHLASQFRRNRRNSKEIRRCCKVLARYRGDREPISGDKEPAPRG